MARGSAPAPALLASIALGAAVVHQLFWLLPLALALGLPALFWGNAFIAGLALVAFVLLAWVLQPSEPSPPNELKVQDAPCLYERVHALADALQTPRLHAIALDDELNAGALELNCGVSLRPVRRVLILGRPLLAALDAAAVEAVIAHELGHFSRRHGRLGHWLYRTRQSWVAISHLETGPDADSSAWERAAAGFANRFLPWFNRLSLAHMRRCEFEADALAAQVCGHGELARALVLLERLHGGQQKTGDALERRLMRAHAGPPADLLAREVAAWREAATGLPAAEAADGTHPPLPERLAALGVASRDWPWPTESAGGEWLGERWPGSSADAVAALRWRMGHGLLQGLAPGPDATPERRLLIALALGEDEPAQPCSDTPEGQLLRARFELMAGRDAAARVLLEACREHKTAERDVATAWLVQHALGEDAEQRRRNECRLNAVRARRAQAQEVLDPEREPGRVGGARLPAADRQALAEALREHPAVREAWVFGQAATVQGVGYEAIGLLLRLDPVRLTEPGLEEDTLTGLAHELLDRVAPPGLLREVLTRYTTEGLPPLLAQGLAATAATRLF